MIVNQLERAYRTWPILIQVAKDKDKITYGQLAQLLNIHHRAVRFALSIIQDYCIEEKLPPLTILVVNKSEKPGAGFIACDLKDFETELSRVWRYDWKSQENPFNMSASGHSLKSLITTLVNEPESSSEVYSHVASRGIKQMLFRSALLKAYKQQCAFTKLSFVEALEACHIIPWVIATDSERLDIRNGILLNSLHHKMFDRGLITISPDHKIVFYDPQKNDGNYSEFDSLITSDIHGKKMHLPSKLNQQPSAEYITRHHNITGWKF